jgi:Haem-binding domain
MSPRIKKVLRVLTLVGIVIGVGIQFVPVEGIASNPPERFALGAPPEVEGIMRRACFDCHSNETKWPLYSRIAPGSWLMARDVTKGRKHLNLSKWGDSDDEERQLDRENCWDKVEAGEMPPWFYVYPMHMGAKLSEADKASLKAWLLKDKGKDTAAKDEDRDKDAAKDTAANKGEGADKDHDHEKDKDAENKARPNKN